MLKRIAAVCLAVIQATCVQAQDAAPAQAESPVINRAVMTADQVVRILDETVDWYRMLGVQQQSAAQPSDLLILYANRQAADRVVALVFVKAVLCSSSPRSPARIRAVGTVSVLVKGFCSRRSS